MNYTWSYGPATITNIDGLQEVIISIAWSCIGYEPGSIQDFKMTGSVDTPPVDPNQFIPFENISKEQVESWVFAVVDRNQVEASLLAESEASPTIIPFNF